MENKLSKRMGLISAFVIFFGVLNMIALLLRTESAIGIWGIWETDSARWDGEHHALKIFILSAYALAGLALNVLAMMFMLRSVTLMKSGLFFSKANVVVLRWSVLAYFVYDLCADNYNILYGMSKFIVQSDTIFLTCVLLGFAMIYNAGLRLSEENKLTI